MQVNHVSSKSHYHNWMCGIVLSRPGHIVYMTGFAKTILKGRGGGGVGIGGGWEAEGGQCYPQ